MRDLNFTEATVNCSIWALDALRTAGITEEELQARAGELKEAGQRALLLQFDPMVYDDVDLYLEFVGVKANKLTGKEERVYCFVKKRYANSTYTYNSCEFTITS